MPVMTGPTLMHTTGDAPATVTATAAQLLPAVSDRDYSGTHILTVFNDDSAVPIYVCVAPDLASCGTDRHPWYPVPSIGRLDLAPTNGATSAVFAKTASGTNSQTFAYQHDPI